MVRRSACRGFSLLEVATAVGLVLIFSSVAVVGWDRIQDGADDQGVVLALAGTQSDLARQLAAETPPTNSTELVDLLNASGSEVTPFFVEGGTAALTDDGQGRPQISVAYTTGSPVLAVAMTEHDRCILMAFSEAATTWGEQEVLSSAECKADLFSPAQASGTMDDPSSV